MTKTYGVSATSNRRHDLPPKWDGETIVWGEWTRHPNRHHRRAQDGCTKCHTVPHFYWTNSGVTPTEPKWPLYLSIEKRLVVIRCHNCGHDIVFDHANDQWWDLDASDYTAQGSRLKLTLIEGDHP